VLPLFIDEGLPNVVAVALRVLRLDAFSNGDDPAPPKGSTDDVNVEWCADRGAVMVTNDRGKKDRVILSLLERHRVHAVFVYRDLRTQPPHVLARALLCAEATLDDLAGRRSGLISHRLTPSGRLKRRQ
jgi:hypothetical protein